MDGDFRGQTPRDSVVRCEPGLLDTRSAREFLGGISENTLRSLLAGYGVEPVKIHRRVMWCLEDLRRVVLRLPRGDGAEGTR